MIKEESQELFNDVLDQYTATSLLSAAIKKNQIAPAYLFCGPNGVGRSLTARRFIEGLITGGSSVMRERKRIEKMNHPDMLWIEPTYLHQGNLIPQSIAKKESVNRRTIPLIRLEQIREIKKFLSKQPLETKLGIVVVEAVEMMNEAASNALLKTLEEPGNGLLILISERPERLLPTIRSRCQNIPFSRLSQDAIKKILSTVPLENSHEILIEVSQKELINLSNGSPGALIANIKAWQEVPEEIWSRLKNLTQEPIYALSLARDLTQALDVEQQIWLINLLQQYMWNQNNNWKPIKELDSLRSYLSSYVQPRLAWEITLLKISQPKT